MTYRQFSILLLLTFLIFINHGVSHMYEATYDYVEYPSGAVSTWESSTDVSNNHPTVSAGANASITKSPLRGRNGWHIGASGSADVYAHEYVRWSGMTPDVIWPRGEYYLHARVEKKDDLGVFRTVKSGDQNTIILVPYASPLSRATYAPYSEENSVEPDMDDYNAYGVSYVNNRAADPNESAGASASR